MGKGFNNYMCKKFFHPASRDNLKRVWMAEQRTDAERKKQEDLRQQYEREQELYQNRALLSKESKEKLEVNFMYDPPPGARKEDKEKKEAEEGETGYKFEWQRKWGTAPRESWAKGDDSIKDQPFGICVRNVRCVKCHKYGHINTDKECPMYGKAADSEEPASRVDQAKLIEQMREDGMKMRWSAWDMENSKDRRKYQMLEDPDADAKERAREKAERKEDEAVRKKMAMIQNMSKEEKRKLLKQLDKTEKKKAKKSKKHKKAKKKKKSRRRDSSSDSSSSSSSDDEDDRRKSDKRRRRRDSSSDRDHRRDRRRSRSPHESRRRRRSDSHSDEDRSRRRHR